MHISWGWLGYSVAVTVLTFCFGVWFFERSEAAMVDSL
jgi:hypothetical protein